MNMDELITQLNELHVKVAPGTLRRWASQELIPSPARYQEQGQKGWLSDWPEETVWQAAVTHTFLHKKWLTTNKLVAVRKIALKCLSNDTTLIKLLNVARYDYREDMFGKQTGYGPYAAFVTSWISCYLKAKFKFPIDMPSLTTFKDIEDIDHSHSLEIAVTKDVVTKDFVLFDRWEFIWEPTPEFEAMIMSGSARDEYTQAKWERINLLRRRENEIKAQLALLKNELDSIQVELLDLDPSSIFDISGGVTTNESSSDTVGPIGEGAKTTRGSRETRD